MFPTRRRALHPPGRRTAARRHAVNTRDVRSAFHLLPAAAPGCGASRHAAESLPFVSFRRVLTGCLRCRPRVGPPRRMGADNAAAPPAAACSNNLGWLRARARPHWPSAGGRGRRRLFPPPPRSPRDGRRLLSPLTPLGRCHSRQGRNAWLRWVAGGGGVDGEGWFAVGVALLAS